MPAGPRRRGAGSRRGRAALPRSDRAGYADALFFAGDLGQRIFQQPFSWKALGINVQGRSATLKVNYRTSHQIREAADRLMGASVADADGERDDRRGTISVFNGPEPSVVLADSVEAEQAAVAAFIKSSLADGVRAEEIGVFVRTRAVIGRARDAVRSAGAEPFELTLHKEGAGRGRPHRHHARGQRGLPPA